jgi:uncharacterized protein
MRITNELQVEQSPDAVWEFFGDIPQVAACLPGTSLTDLADDGTYTGDVVIKAGPVKLEFTGSARITARDDATRTMQVEGAGAERKGRGQASLLLDAALSPTPRGTRIGIALDLALSGAAAQYGRGLVADVTAVLLDEFGSNMQARLTAIQQGLDPDAVATGKPTSGLTFALRAAMLALSRVFRRFFLPYRPQPTGR